MSKKYVWLKLKDDFFQQKAIKKLRKIAGGDTYTIIYLKLQLLSLKNEGKLFYEGVEENFAGEMALTIDEDVENVKITLLFLEKNNLLEKFSSEEYFLPKVAESIGTETAAAERMRKMRNLKSVKAIEVKEKERNNVTPKRNNVTRELRDVTNCYTEKEEEEDIEIEKDIEITNSKLAYSLKSVSPKSKRIDCRVDKSTSTVSVAANIIKFLNEKAGKSFRTNNSANLRIINARLKEGYTEEDFKLVIDTKVSEWKGDSKMNAYLRPSTLFSPTNFENYLVLAKNNPKESIEAMLEKIQKEKENKAKDVNNSLRKRNRVRTF